jgi:mannosyltransferase OCH1-like enzyme
MIPKIIHYCWFGGNPMPEDHAAYIAGWRKLLPDYKIKLWDETNFDVNTVLFTEQVAKVKKWGFIVDYIRAYVVYNYGGIYLDTDVELLKPFDNDMLQNKCFSGFENYKNIAPGLIFAGEKGCVIAKELLDFYSTYNFIKEDGELNLTASPVIFTSILLKYSLKQNNTLQELDFITVYPTEYFCPKDIITGTLKITKNTYAIHHYAASWVQSNAIKAYKRRHKIFSVFGDTIVSRVIVFCDLLVFMICNLFYRFFVKPGPIRTLKHYYGKIRSLFPSNRK